MDTDTKSDEKALTFTELSRRLDEAPEYEDDSPKSLKWARFGLALFVTSLSLAYLVGKLPLSEAGKARLMVILVGMEIAGVATLAWNNRKDFSILRNPLKDYGSMLDHDVSYHIDLVNWLTSQPRSLLEHYATMAKFRRERINQKLPLVTGSLASLGLIPIIIGVYLQIREYAAGRHIGLLDVGAGIVIAALYGTSWMGVLMKSRIELMDMYLQYALESTSDDKETDHGTV